jgi:hypothetical protein
MPHHSGNVRHNNVSHSGPSQLSLCKGPYVILAEYAAKYLLEELAEEPRFQLVLANDKIATGSVESGDVSPKWQDFGLMNYAHLEIRHLDFRSSPTGP